ncbi:Cytochrome b/b6-like domain-containing protein [Dioscorea alata]|uniref:Cytochrome b/b6-like domain-containing protein n=1 Tax=Dioscorea alata TaxID=55571 RepID=A0ACB7UVK0_DIOAL|nr:Cytochrome b/b6-like domain-containing protein [Dioscorea alata]
MEWRKSYLDLTLVPLGILFSLLYHAWLWHKVRSQPLDTIIGINSAGRRLWVLAMFKDNEKKNILAVQTIRNAIMGSTLMATTSILLSSGLAAIISSTYSVKQPIGDSVYGAHGEVVVAMKYVVLLLFFLLAFLCYSLSIRFMNQVNFLINVPLGDMCPVSTEYVTELLERGFMLNTMGNRLFYAAMPLLLWIFGPVLVFLSSATMVPILYNLDVVYGKGKGKGKGEGKGSMVGDGHGFMQA